MTHQAGAVWGDNGKPLHQVRDLAGLITLRSVTNIVSD